MFALTITTRDYIPLTISGEAVSVITACMVMQSGLQVRQVVSVEVAHGTASHKVTLHDVRSMTTVVEALIGLLQK